MTSLRSDKCGNNWRRWAALLAVALFGGCALDDLRGPGFKDEDLTKDIRVHDPTANGSWGFSTKARQIESNLGVD